MKADNLLRLATHATTPDNEALSAIRKLGQIIDAKGGVEHVFGGSAKQLPELTFNEKRRLISKLENDLEVSHQEIKKFKSRIDFLTKENFRLEAEATAKTAAMKERIEKRNDGSLPFPEFAFKAKTILRTKAWVSAFCEQTGIEEIVVTRQRAAGMATPEMVSKLATLRPEVTVRSFTVEEVAKIREWADNYNNVEIAEFATESFLRDGAKRIITESMIRKLRTDLKQGNGVFREREYGGRLPIKGDRRPTLDWLQYPAEELEICEKFITGSAGTTTLAKWATKKLSMDIGTNQITNRVYNNAPPAKLISEEAQSGPLTWAEVWLISAELRDKDDKDNKSWIVVARRELNLPVRVGEVSVRPGYPLDKIDPAIVASFRRQYRAEIALNKSKWMSK